MKKAIFSILFSLIISNSFADTIKLVNGEQISATVVEVGKNEIKYTLTGKSNPVYVLETRTVESIVYDNGSTDHFTSTENKDLSKEKNRNLKVIKWASIVSATTSVLATLYWLSTRF